MITFADDGFSAHFNAGFMPTWVRALFVSAPRDLQNDSHPRPRLSARAETGKRPGIQIAGDFRVKPERFAKA
jgi:hypothetical protein